MKIGAAGLPEYTSVGRLDEFAAGRIREFEVNGRLLCGVRMGERVFAFDRYCPHEFVELTYGYILERQVHCAQHGAAFDLEDGTAMAGPADADIRVYSVRIEDGNVLVLVE